MIRIKVRGRNLFIYRLFASLSVAVILVIFFGIIPALLYHIITHNYVSPTFANIVVIVVTAYVYYILNKNSQKETYVKELQLFDDYINLIYENKKTREKFTKKIDKNEIINFHLKSKRKISYTGKGMYTELNSKIEIKLRNNKKITFKQNSDDLSGTENRFIYSLFKNLDKIPNFTYDIENASDYTLAQIEHIKKYGKNAPFIKVVKYLTKEEKLSFIIICAIISVLTLIFIFNS